jgi:hypothetical protein
MNDARSLEYRAPIDGAWEVDFVGLICSAEGDDDVAEQDLQTHYNTPNARLPWSSLWARCACHESLSAESQIKLYLAALEANTALADELRRYVDDMN